MNRSDARDVFLAIAALLSISISASTAAAQQNLLPGAADEQAEEVSPELSEVRKKTEELQNRLREWKAKADEYERAGREAKPRMDGLDQEIERLQNREAIQISPRATAVELDAQLMEAEQDLAAARRDASDLDNQAELRSERRKKIP